MKHHIRIGLAWSALMIVVMIGIILFTGSQLPADGVGLHFRADGSADRFGTRREALLGLALLPALTAMISGILAVAPLLDPRKQNVTVGRRGYLAVWIAVTGLMTLVTAGIAASMLGNQPSMAAPAGIVRWIVAGSALVFVIVGNYLPKTRSSFIFGIRTPWTLSSDIAWEKTHRLAGPLFIAAGVLGCVGAFVFNGVWLALQLSALALGAALICVVYSYFAWRKAPDRDHGTNLTV